MRRQSRLFSASRGIELQGGMLARHPERQIDHHNIDARRAQRQPRRVPFAHSDAATARRRRIPAVERVPRRQRAAGRGRTLVVGDLGGATTQRQLHELLRRRGACGARDPPRVDDGLVDGGALRVAGEGEDVAPPRRRLDRDRADACHRVEEHVAWTGRRQREHRPRRRAPQPRADVAQRQQRPRLGREAVLVQQRATRERQPHHELRLQQQQAHLDVKALQVDAPLEGLVHAAARRRRHIERAVRMLAVAHTRAAERRPEDVRSPGDHPPRAERGAPARRRHHGALHLSDPRPVASDVGGDDERREQRLHHRQPP